MRAYFLPIVATSVAFATPALAKEIRLPEDHPQLVFQVPDDWTITYDGDGLNAASPESNSFIYAKIMKRPKDDPNKWVSDVLAKLETQGVTFKTKATVAAKTEPKGAETKAAEQKPAAEAKPGEPSKAAEPPKAADPVKAAEHAEPAAKPSEPAKPDQPAKPSEPAKTAEAKPAAASADAKPDVPAKTEPATPAAVAATAPKPDNEPPPPVMAAAAPISGLIPAPAAPTVTALGPPIMPLEPEAPPRPKHFPRHALPYKDTARNGTPVDVELMTYNLPDKSVFFLMQESGKTDDRIVGIVNSVKPAN